MKISDWDADFEKMLCDEEAKALTNDFVGPKLEQEISKVLMQERENVHLMTDAFKKSREEIETMTFKDFILNRLRRNK